MSGTFRYFRRAGGASHLPLNPFAIHGGDGGLRGNLLGKKTVCRGGWHAAGRGMRLVQKAGILQVRHDVADRSRAQRLFKALGYGARGHRFTGFDVHAHDIRQDLAVTPFLESRIPHSSTLLLVLKSATYIVGSVSSAVNGAATITRCRFGRAGACRNNRCRWSSTR